MKKLYAAGCCLLIFFSTSAQNNTDTSSSLNFAPGSDLKVIVHLKNNVKHAGTITQIKDSTILLLETVQKENSIKYANSNLLIRDVKSIRIKRHAFIVGMLTGAVATGFVSYEFGVGAYTNDPILNDQQNKDNANIKGYKYAAIGIVPGAAIGGLIGSIIIKRKFRINGDVKNIKRMVKAFSRFDKHK